jgi:hypothetical protein
MAACFQWALLLLLSTSHYHESTVSVVKNMLVEDVQLPVVAGVPCLASFLPPPSPFLLPRYPSLLRDGPEFSGDCPWPYRCCRCLLPYRGPNKEGVRSFLSATVRSTVYSVACVIFVVHIRSGFWFLVSSFSSGLVVLHLRPGSSFITQGIRGSSPGPSGGWPSSCRPRSVPVFAPLRVSAVGSSPTSPSPIPVVNSVISSPTCPSRLVSSLFPHRLILASAAPPLAPFLPLFVLVCVLFVLLCMACGLDWWCDMGACFVCV